MGCSYPIGVMAISDGLDLNSRVWFFKIWGWAIAHHSTHPLHSIHRFFSPGDPLHFPPTGRKLSSESDSAMFNPRIFGRGQSPK
jgi:hypothetical protein